MTLVYDDPCPGCKRPIGDHTIRGYGDCLQAAGFDYELPHEDVPDGPVRMPGVEGSLVGEVVIRSAVLDTLIGRLPALQFTFIGAGSRPLPPITLVMDDRGLMAFQRLVTDSVRSAIGAAKQ